MENVYVNLKKNSDESYNIYIGNGISDFITENIHDLNLAYSYAVVTDSNVEKLYAEKFIGELKKIIKNVHLISFPAGESSKSKEMKSHIEDLMFELKLGRDSAVIALGGGVVGDLAGFVASTYMRGLPYIQIPTTLVACVDSSIGGKTGIDTKYGKNLIGAFHQPRAVFIDTTTLKTLKRKEVSEGLAEVIKYGVIRDGEFFQYLHKNIKDSYTFKEEVLNHIIKTGCIIKADVVEKDEKESNLRKILNFGHTVGHAIEQLSEYKISHGEAISIGMVIESEIALSVTGWDKQDHNDLKKLINKTDLPLELPDNMESENIIEIMKKDKKVRKGTIEMSLPDSIGKMYNDSGQYGIKVEEDLIHSVLK